MKYCLAIAALSVTSLLAQTPAGSTKVVMQDGNTVVLTIGNEKITAKEYDQLIEALPPQYQQNARGAGRREFAEQIVQLKILSAEATRQKLDQEAKARMEISFSRDNILAGVMFQKLQEGVKVDDAAIQKAYDEHKADYEMVKARHILIRVKDAPMPAAPGKPELTDELALAKAQDIRKRLVAGEDFAKIAMAESDDTGSGAQGGDLGEFKKGMMVPPFEQAAFAAKVGDITEPVKSPFGYHIIKVEAHSNKSLADVKEEISAKLKPDMARQSVEAMRKAAKVTISDDYFGPEKPATDK